MKYYVVKKGNKPGLYNNWEDCKKEILGYKGAVYKSFSDYNDAINYLNDNLEEFNDDVICYIDGSFDIKTNNYSFGGILINKGNKFTFKKAFMADEFSKYRNVAGEIKGAAYIMNYCYKNNILSLTLCYDYIGIEKWYDGSWQAKSDIAILYTYFIKNIKDKLSIKFVKIKSHTNNKYNELADKLAKEALGI